MALGLLWKVSQRKGDSRLSMKGMLRLMKKYLSEVSVKGERRQKKGFSQDSLFQYSEFQKFDCDPCHEMDMLWNTFSIATQDIIYAYVYIQSKNITENTLNTTLIFSILVNFYQMLVVVPCADSTICNNVTTYNF